MSCSRIRINRFRFCTSIVLDALRICAARTEAGAEQSGVRSASGGTGDVSRAGGLLFHAVRRRTRRNVCLRLQTAQKRRPPHRQPRTASYLRAPHNLLPAEQKSGRRKMRAANCPCADLGALRDFFLVHCHFHTSVFGLARPGGSGIVRFGRIENAGVCGASACAAACRSSMPRPLRKKQNASALFLTRRRKGVSPAPPHMECRYARGVPEKQACADAACAYVREDAASTAAALLGKVRLRSRSVRADSAQTLCAFRRDVSGNAAAESGEAVFTANKKTTAARSRRRLSFTRFSSRRGRTEG